ncbi:trimeric intracellular cation channel family protein [Cryomorpha ignava]|nr:trimeric intracellular cation channel family protein [Cryomorpha ignava]
MQIELLPSRPMDIVYILDIIGVFVFATSGVLTAIDNKFDLVGSAVIGFITALGGGTLRDIMIGQTPVGWMYDVNYLWTILAALILSYLFRKRIVKLRRSLFVFDTIGIGLFTILGLQRTLATGLDPAIALIMGMVSAVFGGVLRDVLTNEIPLIFRREIYATACLAGGLVFLLLTKFYDHELLAMAISMGTVFIIRYMAVRYNWSLNLRARN